MARNRAPSRDQLPTLGSIAASGIGLTVWCDDDACSYRRERGYRYQIVNTTEPRRFCRGLWPRRDLYRMAKAAALLGPRQREDQIRVGGAKTRAGRSPSWLDFAVRQGDALKLGVAD